MSFSQSAASAPIRADENPLVAQAAVALISKNPTAIADAKRNLEASITQSIYRVLQSVPDFPLPLAVIVMNYAYPADLQFLESYLNDNLSGYDIAGVRAVVQYERSSDKVPIPPLFQPALFAISRNYTYTLRHIVTAAGWAFDPYNTNTVPDCLFLNALHWRQFECAEVLMGSCKIRERLPDDSHYETGQIMWNEFFTRGSFGKRTGYLLEAVVVGIVSFDASILEDVVGFLLMHNQNPDHVRPKVNLYSTQSTTQLLPPLMVAAVTGNVNVLQMLLAARANPLLSAPDRFENTVALNFAMQPLLYSSEIYSGDNPGLTKDSGIFHFSMGHIECISLLLQHELAYPQANKPEALADYPNKQIAAIRKGIKEYEYGINAEIISRLIDICNCFEIAKANAQRFASQWGKPDSRVAKVVKFLDALDNSNKTAAPAQPSGFWARFFSKKADDSKKEVPAILTDVERTAITELKKQLEQTSEKECLLILAGFTKLSVYKQLPKESVVRGAIFWMKAQLEKEMVWDLALGQNHAAAQTASAGVVTIPAPDGAITRAVRAAMECRPFSEAASAVEARMQERMSAATAAAGTAPSATTASAPQLGGHKRY